jgi:hypothetical protein
MLELVRIIAVYLWKSDIIFSRLLSRMATTAEWTDENTRILTELFVAQVRMGNRPNTYLTPNAFEEVAIQFKNRTGLEYKHAQLKNKWDKLKQDYNIFKRLKLRETGGGWDHEKNTVKQDPGWWKLAKIVSSRIIFFYIIHLTLVTDKWYFLLYYRILKDAASLGSKDFAMKKI